MPYRNALVTLSLSLLVAACLTPSQGAVAQSLVLTHSTLIGERLDARQDSTRSVVVDDHGNVYVGGVTQFPSRDRDDNGIPTTPASLMLESLDHPDEPCSSRCSYVLKLDRNLGVIYGAILPELDLEDIAVDGSGAVYATGLVRHTIRGERSATPGAFSGNGEAFVLKISPDGSALDYLARFPGRTSKAIAVDPDGTTYIVGEIAAPGLPTTVDAVKPAYANAGPGLDGYLLKIGSRGDTLLFGTYLGGSGLDGAYDVAPDGSGGAIVGGFATSADFVGFPGGAFGDKDAYVMRVSPDGKAIVAGRYFGGNRDEDARAVSVVGSGGYVVGGVTSSPNFPVTGGVIQPWLLGTANGWVSRLDANLNIVYTTFLGGSFFDGFEAVAADSSGRAYVFGVTFSGDMLTTADGFQSQSSQYSRYILAGAGPDFYPLVSDEVTEAYLAVLSPDATRLEYGTYLGGTYPSQAFTSTMRTLGWSMARSSDGLIHAVGETNTVDFPSTGDGFRSALGGGRDGFLVRFRPQALRVTTQTRLPDAAVGEFYAAQLEATSGIPPYRWELVGFRLPDGLALLPDGRIQGTTENDQTENYDYQFTVRVTDFTDEVAYRNLVISPDHPGGAECRPNYCELTVNVFGQFNYLLPLPSRSVPPLYLDVLGTLPPGVSVNFEHSSFGGNPSTAGDYRFSFRVSSFSGAVSTFDWRIVVRDPRAPPPPTPPSPTPPPSSPPPGASSGSGSGSGGGSFGAVELLALLLTMTATALPTRSRRRRLSRPGNSPQSAPPADPAARP